MGCIRMLILEKMNKIFQIIKKKKYSLIWTYKMLNHR